MGLWGKPPGLVEFSGANVAERAVRELEVVFKTPRVDHDLRFGKAREQVLIQAFVTEFAIEALDVGVLDAPSRPDESQTNAPGVRPLVKNPASELRAVVHADSFGGAARGDHPVELASLAQSDDRRSAKVARLSFVKLSTSVRQRMRRPLANASASKSMDQLSFGRRAFQRRALGMNDALSGALALPD